MIKRCCLSALFIALLSLTGCYSEGKFDVEAARIALQKRQLNQAIRLTTRAMLFGELKPDQMLEVIQIRAKAFWRKASTSNAYRQAALQDAGKWIELEPENHFALFHRASMLLSFGETEAALADYDDGLKRADAQGTSTDERLAGPYVRRALIKLEKKEFTLAKVDVDRAMVLDDTEPDAHLAQSFLLEKDGKVAEALHEMEYADVLFTRRQNNSHLLEAPVANMTYFKRLYKLREARKLDPMKRSESFAEVIEKPSAPEPADEAEDWEKKPLVPR